MSSRTLVISFHRSGLHWLRHATEYFGGIRTPGRATHLIAEGPILFDRTHDITRPNRSCPFIGLRDAGGREIYQRVGLLLRNPYDTFVSHYLLRKDLRFKRALADFETFAINIAGFESLMGAEREVFHFEDFASNEAGTMKMLQFFGVLPKGPTDFNALVESSKAWYREHQGLFDKSARPELKPRQREAIRKMLAGKLGTSFNKYLGRYH